VLWLCEYEPLNVVTATALVVVLIEADASVEDGVAITALGVAVDWE
jgi:hypothetical protein